MKRIVVLILIISFLLPYSTKCIAQDGWTDEHSRAAGYLIGLGLRKAAERADERRKEKQEYEEEQRAKEEEAREQAREQERIELENKRIELENKKLESERKLQEMREANVDPFIDCYWIDEEGNLSLDQSCLEWKMFASMKYVDLGLPSGTLWGASDMMGFYTYHEASGKFGSQLPSKQQFEELRDKCTWSWLGGYCKIIGPNGNCIYLIASGLRDCDGDVGYVGSNGGYWSSTPYDSDDAWRLYFFSSEVDMYYLSRCYGLSVRLVQ